MTPGSVSSGPASSARRRPRLLPSAAALAALVLTVSLGNWQMRRADEKRALQHQQEAVEQARPLALTGALAAGDAAALDGRRVVLEGRWVDERTVFLDNRTYQGQAGFHVATPLALADAPGLQVLVLRGWVPRDPRERLRLPQLPASSQPVRIEGVALARLPSALQLGDAAQRREGPGERIWQSLSVEAFARWSGARMAPVIVRQLSDSGDGLVRDWPRPGSDVDKHLGYAVQWYAMAAAVAALWLYFGWLRADGPRKNHD